MSDRLAVMNDGEIEQIGTPKETYEEPASAYVADFLGVANLLPATVNGSQVESWSTAPSTPPTRSASAVNAPSSFAPSACCSSPLGSGQVEAVPAVVEQRVYVGAVTQVLLRLGEHKLQALVANDGSPLCGAEGETVDAYLRRTRSACSPTDTAAISRPRRGCRVWASSPPPWRARMLSHDQCGECRPCGEREDQHDRRECVERRRRRGAPAGVDLHRHGLARRAGRQERRDHEVVDRSGEHHHHTGEDGRTEQRQQHQSHGLQAVGAEVARRLFVLRADRRQPTADDHDDVRDAERDVPEQLSREPARARPCRPG